MLPPSSGSFVTGFLKSQRRNAQMGQYCLYSSHPHFLQHIQQVEKRAMLRFKVGRDGQEESPSEYQVIRDAQNNHEREILNTKNWD